MKKYEVVDDFRVVEVGTDRTVASFGCLSRNGPEGEKIHQENKDNVQYFVYAANSFPSLLKAFETAVNALRVSVDCIDTHCPESLDLLNRTKAILKELEWRNVVD
jgi:hypothetical protein